LTRTSERGETRIDDRVSESAMEDRKKTDTFNIMNTFIELFTDESLLRPSSEKTKIQPIHIFHELVEYYAYLLSETDIRLLYAQFKDVENALALSRRRELHPAKQVFEKIAAQQLEYSDFIRNGMFSMLKAAVAYYEYACGRNEEAIDLLEQAIVYSMTQGINFPQMLAAAQDQWLNIARVRMRQGDLNGALTEMNALISFSLTGEVSGAGVEGRFHFNAGGRICDRFWELEPEIHHLVLNFVTGITFSGTLEYCNNDFSLAGNFYGQIINEAARAIQGRQVIQWARSPIMLLHLFYTGQKELFLEGISKQFEDVRQAAPGLQWLIISNYVTLLRETRFDLESHPNYKRLFEAYRSLGFSTDLLKPAVQEMG
jgi:tetratricopeptide (TPR) repeat protein